MIRLFTGWDFREAIGWTTFCHSVTARASAPLAIIPMTGHQFDGSNAFTYSRFFVPQMCDYQGWAIFADGCDQVCLADMADLWALRDERYAVQVVKHDYQTRDAVKYRGTEMECRNVNYRCKNWSSLMLINCGHPKAIRSSVNWTLESHQFAWLTDDEIGSLPPEWNWLCDEYGENAEAKILHWTRGLPCFTEYRDTPMAEHWFGEYLSSQRGLQPPKEVLCSQP